MILNPKRYVMPSSMTSSLLRLVRGDALSIAAKSFLLQRSASSLVLLPAMCDLHSGERTTLIHYM
jgi:hypothetical protein